MNQVAVEALYSATYVENYLDCVENLPDDLQRHLSRMRDIDAHYRECLRAVGADLNLALLIKNDLNSKKRARAIERIKTSLINAQEFGDEKLHILQLLQDLIDHKSRQLDIDYRNLVSCLDYGNGNNVKEEAMAVETPSSVKESGSTAGEAGGTGAQQGAASTGGGQGGATRAPASPPHNHDRDRDRTDKDRTAGERASKRARRSRNDTATGNDNERGGGLDGRSAGADREPPAPAPPPLPPPPDPPQRNTGGNSSNKKAGTGKLGTGKKKKRKSRQSAQSNQRDSTPPPEEPDPIDPDEPTYCLCDQISFGEMILCDNDLCPIEWFHFSCVSLATKPKGKWFCPMCRGDRPNVMKPKLQFLKELERFNKEKEEKA